MKLVYAFGTLFLIAVICIESGYGIKCFVCNSYHQQDCGDWFDNATHSVHECDKDQDRCRKIVQQIKVEDEWQVRYIRQCASGGEIGAYDGRVCRDRIGTSGVKMTYCHCSTEGCNSASAWNVPVLLMVGAFTGQYIWRKL